MAVLHQLAKRLEHMTALDAAAEPLSRAVRGFLARRQPLRDLLSGTNLGHPLHPVLTDVPIGAWSMSALLDLAGGRRSRRAADLLVVTGVLSALPTAAAGWNDWSDTKGGARRVGVAHAAANSAALVLYTASLAARCAGRRGRGRVLGLAGLGALMAGGYLGGHLTFVDVVNANRTAFEQRPGEWTPVLAESELGEGAQRAVRAGDAVVLLHRSGGAIHALANTCSHLGGPLDQGKISGGCVTCPWHGSTFSLADGTVVHGPASSPQPVYETRVRDGHIEVRARD
ncbi:MULTISPECIES: Rieske (2Fe-2S) protein [Streptomycetaceae]|uniref:Putative iron-sulfur protein n=1 Tax=Streptantibioticus cattleyicolor (strain ATCC 35852 / DSM 46488 / JCM 4925 / NBRC 14057 / NRRL 8057) TaxID=1003195 RepID=F8K0J3_STREN|nr:MULTISPECIES: Rieske (2Fe-2S) protein [Streptomycetaceae]AEW97398.1 putative iron-sulfur protein [Streptantibioticus cattleyicolor NRRL 8057 = DSM 46488]MYS61843.1 Rieske 2Fe-2S domain-containing protein [Streptomyces sp. SID5468]CCB77721.1 putative iron-sulfur protein [Streptantibioticus cattleyicolor NRRL 8057 = DSM 46488]